MNPEDDQRLCDSRIWWPCIKELAQEFETELLKEKENAGLIQFQERMLESALEMYEQSWHRFKVHTYGEKAKDEHIDKHKVISLYVLSFLAKEPFFISNKANGDLRFANELFALEVMLELICLWENGSKIFEMDENEKKWLVILFNNVRIKLTESKPSVINDNHDRIVDFLFLAQVIYYIEKSYQ